MIEVKEIDPASKAIKSFIRFPFKLYKNEEFWVPPIIADESANLNPSKNPAFKICKSLFLVAYKNDKMVGRLVGIINQNEPDREGESVARFGWLDAINDEAVFQALFQKLEQWCRTNGVGYIEGPEGFSNLDRAAMLVDGFDKEQLMSTIYNFPYYPEMMEKLGYEKDRDFLEFVMPFPRILNKRYLRGVEILEKRFGFKVAPIKSKKDLVQYIKPAFEVLNRSYEGLPGFIPLTEEQIEYYGRKYVSILDPKMVKIILDKNDKFAGFSVVMPHITPAMKKANGRLFPFGWWHLKQALKHSKELDLLLIGVVPEHQSRGLNALIFYYTKESLLSRNFEKVYFYPRLEDNNKMEAVWKDFELDYTCTRRIYIKKLM